MQIQYELTTDNLVALGHHTARTSHCARRSMYGCLILVPLSLIIIFIIFLPSQWLWSLPLTVLWISAILLWWRKLATLQPSTVGVKSQRPGVLGTHTLQMNANGLREITEVNDTQHSWLAIKAIEQTDQHMFFYLSAVLTHTVPKRAFENSQDAAAFYHTAQQHFHRVRGNIYDPK